MKMWNMLEAANWKCPLFEAEIMTNECFQHIFKRMIHICYALFVLSKIPYLLNLYLYFFYKFYNMAAKVTDIIPI